MIATYRKIFELLTPYERRRFYLLLAMIIVMGLTEMAGVASILPFLAVLGNPEIASTNPYLAAIYQAFGFESERAFMIFLGCLVFAVVLFSLAFKSLTLYATARFSYMRNHSISSRLLGGYLHQPYVWFLYQHSADLARTVLAEVNRVVNEAMLPAMRIIAQGVSLLFLVGLLLIVDFRVALIAAIVLGGSYGLIFLVFRKILTRLGYQMYTANSERFLLAQEAMGGIKEVKILGLENSYLGRYLSPSRRFAASASARQIISELPRQLLEAIAIGGMLVLVLFLLLTGEGGLTDLVPILGVFAFATLRMFPAVQQIYQSLTLLRVVGPALDAVHRGIRETGANIPLPPNISPIEPIRLCNRLELLDVSYTYPQASHPAIHSFSLKIAANTTVGIVGGTGAGKTTAVDLILGLLGPQTGEVRVDGVTITDENLRAWQRAIGYVPQQIFLIDDTISANIAFGIPPEERDQAAVERAARLAELDRFVREELPQGYDTPVGERGVRLSGGQRQRIGIARALYHDPNVLILDEATSALDNLTERAVMDAVHNLTRAKTIIMIAHRLSTVKTCDTIFVLVQGKLAAQGTYDELVSKNETFRRMASI